MIDNTLENLKSEKEKLEKIKFPSKEEFKEMWKKGFPIFWKATIGKAVRSQEKAIERLTNQIQQILFLFIGIGLSISLSIVTLYLFEIYSEFRFTLFIISLVSFLFLSTICIYLFYKSWKLHDFLRNNVKELYRDKELFTSEAADTIYEHTYGKAIKEREEFMSIVDSFLKKNK